MQSLQDELTLKANLRLVGQVRQVLVEGLSRRRPEQLCGRLRTNQVVNFDGPPELVGRPVLLELTAAHPHSLKARWLANISLTPQPMADCLPASSKEVSC